MVNFLIPLYVNIYLVYSLPFFNFGGLGSFLIYLLTCGPVVLILEYRTALKVYELRLFKISTND